MKKLLALVLCVMMFVAIIPTNAFAATWADKGNSVKAISEAEKSIKNMYTAIATDEFVFGTAKSLYDFSNGLATQMFDGVDSITNPKKPTESVYHDDLVKFTRQYMNGIIGDSIADYIKNRTSSFTSGTINGGVDPEKYLKVFVAAVNDAVTSEKAQKGLQAFVYDLYALKTMNAVKDQAEDLQTAIKDWGSGKWQEFGTSFDSQTFVYAASFAIPSGIWNAGSNGGDPLTNPWAYTNDATTGAYAGNSGANISTVWEAITTSHS